MNSSLYLAGLFWFASVCLTPHALVAGQLMAGAAVTDISPVKLPALQNGGFLQRSTNRVLDPLHARSLVLSDGTETIAIVIVDSCMFPTSLCDKIKEIASQESGLRIDRILISATHTHAAPAAMMCLGCAADDAYVEYVPGLVAKSIVKAYKGLMPAKLGWKMVDCSDLTNCRRWITRADRMGQDPFGGKTVRAMMHPGYQNSNYTSPAGPIDPWLSVLSIVSAKDESPICLLANLSMHYFGGGGFSADYFGEVARRLESRVVKSHGRSNFVGIMSQGTSGDLHWMDYSQPRTGLNRQQYSAKVTDRILNAWKEIEHRSNIPLGMAERRLTINRRTPSQGRREWARPINVARLDRPPRNRVEVYAQQAEWLHEHPRAEVVLQAVRIGDLAITAIPNEVYGITGLKLKYQSPLPATFNLELANGATGYIPPPEQHRLGGYTTWPARTAGLDEQAEPLIVETLLQLLEKVTNQKRRTITLPQTNYARTVNELKPIAYWRLDELSSTQVEDSVGRNHAKFKGGIALFLEGVEGTGCTTDDYQNRSVYLAGGHLETELPGVQKEYSISLWLKNMLPPDSRDVTGVVLSTANETLRLAGNKDQSQSGKLVLQAGEQSFFGKSLLAIKSWHQVTITKDQKRIRVYLDGQATPEIDAQRSSEPQSGHLMIGSDGDQASTFDGKVDEVAVFDRALQMQDVVRLYERSGMTPPPRPKPAIILGAKPQDANSRAAYKTAVLNSNPIAYWRLHDTPGASAKDAMEQFDAKYEQGASPISRKIAKSFAGGRVKGHVPTLGNTYSVEMWFRNDLPVNSRPVAAYLFSRAADGVAGANGDNLGIGGTHSNMGRLIVFNGNRRNQLIAGTSKITAGSWSHVALVRTENRIRVYLNGNTEPEVKGELPIDYPPGCPDLFLGGRADNFANLHGSIEEVALYDRALTAAEVKTHFDAAGAPSITTIAGVKTGHDETRSQPTPTKANDATATIRVPPQFEVQLVAAEPLVMDPVAIDWGTDGKLWVVEMADYPLGLDGKGQAGGRVRYLEDTDMDGRYDRSTLFAEGISFPNGVLAWGRGILVTAAPEIIYLEDSNRDGKADIRRVLYSGFLEGNQQLRVNGLRWGLDSWVYCASGSHHGGYGKTSQIYSQIAKSKHPIGSRDFRIRPDTGAIDAQSGPSQFGRIRDDWGNWFGVQNSHPLWHYVLADHHIRRNPHFAPPDPRKQVVVPANPRVFPASKLQKRYHSFTQSGRFTSACSPMIYRDDLLFDRGTEQHAFTCEPFHNLVQHNLIRPDGVSFKARRDPNEKQFDFFASEDRWCRPVMTRTGPDGAIWVVDMYRYMIEHPQWLPQNGKDELRPWFRAGDKLGRIYRIVPKAAAPRPIPLLERHNTKELVELLQSPNGWQRDTAQRLLIHQNSAESIDQLIQLASGSKQPLTRLHAIWTLAALEALPTELLHQALQDSHAGVRRNALRIAEHQLVDVAVFAKMAQDPDATVRLQLANTLGYYNSQTASKLLAELAVQAANDPFTTAAVMSSLTPENVADVLEAVVRSSKPEHQPTIDLVLGQAIAMGAGETIDRVINMALAHVSNSSSRTELTLFRQLASIQAALARRKWSVDRLSPATRSTIESATNRARDAAANEDASVELRITAIPLLCRNDNQLRADLELLQQLLVPRTPSIVQRAIVTTLADRGDSDVAKILLSGWRSHSPEIRKQVLDTISSRKSWAEVLRQQIVAGKIRATELNATVQQRLLDVHQNSTKWQSALSQTATQDRAQILRQFRPSLQLPGNVERGAIVFRKKCVNCHQLQNQGYNVGPRLTSITTKTKAALLSSILDPNVAVDAKYFNYTIGTVDGRVFNGKLETETGSSVTLLAAEGKRVTVLRRDIELLQSTGKSLMPEGLERELTPQSMADLIQFILDGIDSTK